MNKLFFISLGLFSAAANSAGFDCSKAATLREILVCESEVLSKLDDSLNNAYNYQISNFPDESIQVKQSQRDWLKSLKVCELDGTLDENCLIQQYKDRIENLNLRKSEPVNSFLGSISKVAPSSTEITGSEGKNQEKTFEPTKEPSAVITSEDNSIQETSAEDLTESPTLQETHADLPTSQNSSKIELHDVSQTDNSKVIENDMAETNLVAKIISVHSSFSLLTHILSALISLFILIFPWLFKLKSEK